MSAEKAPYTGISRAHFQRFTAFEDLELKFGPGVNILIGANGTGKTHVLKAVYAACDILRTGESFDRKIEKVFLPSSHQLGRLVRRKVGKSSARITIQRNESESISISFSSHSKSNEDAKVEGDANWKSSKLTSAYIPVKEMLANAPGFLSTYKQRDMHFEEIYADILERAYLPILKGAPDKQRQHLFEQIGAAIQGSVRLEGEEFFLANEDGSLEFTLLAEGIRKLALILLLIQNGTIVRGSVLFWDEPEANLNPKLVKTVVEIILTLQRLGIQVFLATHDYSVIKWFQLLSSATDKINYISLYKTESGVEHKSTSDYFSIDPNPIGESFDALFEETLRKELDNAQ